MHVTRIGRIVQRAWRVLKDRGVRGFVASALRKGASLLSAEHRPWLVQVQDAAEVDWTARPSAWADAPVSVVSGPVEIAWITSPPGAGSGGHQNLFRFIDFAERAGHRCTVYIYDRAGVSVDTVRSTLRSSTAYPSLVADIVLYERDRGVRAGTQAIFATGWETAYPAFLDPSPARRFYFVQDFEPAFYPVGAESVLAENTYRFGFHGMTAGRWLPQRLAEYGMSSDSYDFAVDAARYRVTNEGERGDVFFYARPVTPRRAFELGMLALSAFHELSPDTRIHLAGWDVSGWRVPFPHRNHASMDVSELNGLYNRCAAGLVLSLTNMSLLPLELLASGVIPVVNSAPNNRLVSDNPHIAWVDLAPSAIARKLVEVTQAPDPGARALEASESVAGLSWEASGRQFVEAFERAMRG